MRRLVSVTFVLLVATPVLADVTAVLKRGALVVKGDDASNNFVVDGVGAPPGSVRISPDSSTTLNGQTGAQIFAGVTSAKIVLGSSADVVTIQSLTLDGQIAIKMGAGGDYLLIDEATITGPAKIDVGSGDNSVQLCDVELRGGASLKIGKSAGGPVTAFCGADGVTGSNASAFVLSDAVVTSDLTVKAAGSSVHMAVVQDSNLQGNLSFKNVALLALCYNGITGNVTAKMPKIVGGLGGGMSCTAGPTQAFANGNTAIAMAGQSIGGAFTVKGAAGDDTVVVTGTFLQGDTTMSLAGGFNFLFFDEVQTASLLAKAGKDQDDLIADALTVQGDATIKYGAGANVIQLGTSTVGGDLTVKTGNDNDVIGTGGTTVGGVKTIADGKGLDTVN